jgi:hypothetical protein
MIVPEKAVENITPLTSGSSDAARPLECRTEQLDFDLEETIAHATLSREVDGRQADKIALVRGTPADTFDLSIVM